MAGCTDLTGFLQSAFANTSWCSLFCFVLPFPDCKVPWLMLSLLLIVLNSFSILTNRISWTLFCIQQLLSFRSWVAWNNAFHACSLCIANEASVASCASLLVRLTSMNSTLMAGSSVFTLCSICCHSPTPSDSVQCSSTLLDTVAIRSSLRAANVFSLV